MNIDLSSIIDNDGGVIPFDGALEITDPAAESALQITGKAVNFSGRIEISADVICVIHTQCARCLEPSDTELDFEIFETVGEDAELNGTVLNLGELVRQHLYINMPIKFLCNYDCKGLCPGCGANLNHNQCDCGNDEIDERLKKLLEFKV